MFTVIAPSCHDCELVRGKNELRLFPPSLTVTPDSCEGGGEGDDVHGGHRAQPEVELQPAPGRRHDRHPHQEVVVQRGEVSDGEVTVSGDERMLLSNCLIN